MTERDIIKAALTAAGVEPIRPRSTTYINPRHASSEEPVEAEQVEQPPTPTPGASTSTRPVPVGDQGPRPTPTGGSGSPMAQDPGPTAKELADRHFQRGGY